MLKYAKQSLIYLLIFLVLGELGARLLNQFLKKPPPYDTSVVDNYLGWKPRGNYAFEGSMQDVEGQHYEVSLSTAYNGFRSYEGKGTDSLRSILVIGDSYTQAVEVADDKTYFHYVGKGLHQPLNAFGMAGYGSLQAYLVLDRYIDSLRPEWIVLQVCTNDFINNRLELEWNSYSNVGLRRPFWDREKEEVVRVVPLPGWKQVLRYSRFYRFVSERIDRLRMQQEGIQTSESQIAELGLAYEPFRASVADTEAVLRLIRDRIPPESNLLIMPADGFQPQFDQLKAICQRLEIEWIETPFAELHRREGAGEVIYSHDGYHWNENGHRIMGKVLLKEIQHRIEARNNQD